MSYDGNGNPTSYGGTSITFDAENKLTAAGSAMTAGYTIEELRAWKQNMSSGVRTYFLYDGTMSVIELTSGGSVSATNTFGAYGNCTDDACFTMFFVRETSRYPLPRLPTAAVNCLRGGHSARNVAAADANGRCGVAKESALLASDNA